MHLWNANRKNIFCIILNRIHCSYINTKMILKFFLFLFQQLIPQIRFKIDYFSQKKKKEVTFIYNN